MNRWLLLFQWIATAYVGAVSLCLSILIGRHLGPAAFGEYGVAVALGAVLGVVLDGGFKNLLLRERTLATDAMAGSVPRLHSLAIGHALMATIVAVVLALVLLPGSRRLALATVVCFCGVVLSQFVSAALRGEGRFAADAFWQIGARTLSAATIAFAIVAGASDPAVILAAWGSGLALAILVLPHGEARRPSAEWHPCIYRTAAFLIWVDLATVVYFRADMPLLKILGAAPIEIGQYAAAYRFVDALTLLSTPASYFVFRTLRLEFRDRVRFRARLVRALAVAAVAGGFASATLHGFARPLVQLAFGSSYGEAAPFLAVLAWSVIFIVPNLVLTQAAIALNHERAYAAIATVVAIVNVALNVGLIPIYGAAGAAGATVATEAALFLLFGIGVYRWCKQPVVAAHDRSTIP